MIPLLLAIKAAILEAKGKGYELLHIVSLLNILLIVKDKIK